MKYFLGAKKIVDELKIFFKKNDAEEKLNIAIEFLNLEDVIKILKRNPGIVKSKKEKTAKTAETGRTAKKVLDGAKVENHCIQHLMLNCTRDTSDGGAVSLAIVDALVAAGADVNAAFNPVFCASTKQEKQAKQAKCIDIIDISAMIHAGELAETAGTNIANIESIFNGADLKNSRGTGNSSDAFASPEPAPRLSILCRCIDMAREHQHYGKHSREGFVLSAMAAKLVMSGADLSTSCGDGLQPIHRAARLGDIGLFDLLIVHGADIFSVDYFGRSALVVAARLEHHDLAIRILQILQKINTQTDCSKQSIDGIKPGSLIDTINQGSAAGDRALHHAAYFGDDVLCKALLLHGALIGLQNRSGNCALHVAAMSGNLDVCICLIDSVDSPSSSFSMTLKNQQGRTALHLAAQFGQGDVCTLLVQRGVNVNAIDNEGRTARGLAKDGGHAHIPALINAQLLCLKNEICLELG